jgi:hypothetical protein
MKGVFIIRCRSCGKRVRYIPRQIEVATCINCGASNNVPKPAGDSGAATYEGQLGQLLPWGVLSLPD